MSCLPWLARNSHLRRSVKIPVRKQKLPVGSLSKQLSSQTKLEGHQKVLTLLGMPEHDQLCVPGPSRSPDAKALLDTQLSGIQKLARYLTAEGVEGEGEGGCLA